MTDITYCFTSWITTMLLTWELYFLCYLSPGRFWEFQWTETILIMGHS